MIRTLPFASALLLLALAAAPAAAQAVIGNPTEPEVTVDRSVLDSLGPEPTLPELLLHRQRPQGGSALATRETASRGIALHPPKKKKAAEAKPKREKPEVAGHPAAAIKPVASNGAVVPRESVAVTPLAEPAPNPPSANPSTEEAALPAAPAAKPAAPAAPTAPTTPTAAPPSPPPVVAAPSPETVTAMKTPPSLPPESPVKPTPAAAPPALSAGEPARILFAGGAADLPDSAKSELDAVVQRLNADEHLRLQLVAYANGTADQANQARRVSLQRALAVRSYLMEHGIANTRMDVRALGNHTDNGDPPDRVDIVMLEH